jgi:predicted cupin superfamily sugar epimerase
VDKQRLIQTLALEPHIEGGFFARTYRSEVAIEVGYASGPRRLLSSIFYMLTDDSPIGYLHKNRSDIIHYFHCGSPLTYWILPPNGEIEKRTLGTELQEGQQLQLIVKGGCWKATELEAGEFALISEAVSPGFEYEDMELAEANGIRKQFPHAWNLISKYVKA